MDTLAEYSFLIASQIRFEVNGQRCGSVAASDLPAPHAEQRPDCAFSDMAYGRYFPAVSL
jgi:hypothetical protein